MGKTYPFGIKWVRALLEENTRLQAVVRAAAALEECTAEMDWGIVHDPESVISRTKEQRKSLAALFLALAAVEEGG